MKRAQIKTTWTRRRGMALVGVMIVLMFILAIALIGVVGSRGTGGLSDRTYNGMTSARARVQSYGAQTVADAGIRAAMQWLNGLASAPTNMVPFRPSEVATFWSGSASGNYDHVVVNGLNSSVEGTFDVRFYPYANNNTAPLRSYVIESVGTYQGRSQIIRAAITQDTFARFAFFADNAPTGIWWSSGTTIFNGPVHINGRNMNAADTANYNANAAIKILWKNTGNPATDDIFRYDAPGAFTTGVSSDQITWSKDNTTSKIPPTSSSDWDSIAVQGNAGIRTSVGMIDMPTQSTKQSDAALGSPPATVPNAPSVTIPTVGSASNGGVYINGDVDNMEMTTGASSSVQVMTIYQNDGTKSYKTVVTITPTGATTGSIQVQKYAATGVPAGGSWTTGSWGTPVTNNYSGTTNGVIYVNGNIGLQGSPKGGGLSGKIADNYMSGGNVVKASSWNIVTDATKSVNINGNITYNSMSSTTPPAAATASGILGIVSNNVQIIRKGKNGSELGDVTVDATVMAYNTFDVEDPLLRNYPTPKNFYLLGGYIAKNPGTFAGIDGNGNTLTGFYVNRYYDSRAASTPPPYFPSTSNQYKILSYQRVTSTLQ